MLPAAFMLCIVSKCLVLGAVEHEGEGVKALVAATAEATIAAAAVLAMAAVIAAAEAEAAL
jgi:predicted aconitase with swiveling domain